MRIAPPGAIAIELQGRRRVFDITWQPRLHSPSPGHPRCEDRWSSDIAATSAATHRPAGVRPSPDRQRIEEPGAHGLTRRVSNEVPRDFGCTSWASGAGPSRASDGFSHVETRRLPEARWQRRVVVRPQDYSGFGLKPQKPTPKSAQLASRAPVSITCARVWR